MHIFMSRITALLICPISISCPFIELIDYCKVNPIRHIYFMSEALFYDNERLAVHYSLHIWPFIANILIFQYAEIESSVSPGGSRLGSGSRSGCQDQTTYSLLQPIKT